MSRKMRPLTTEGLARFGFPCETCSFWESSTLLEVRCGAECDGELLRSRMSEIRREWGECGRMAVDDGVVLGFVKYGPVRYFPQARWLPAGSADADASLVTCLHVRDEARCRGLDKVLLHAALRDLHGRGERCLYAYGRASGDRARSPMPALGFLAEQGFTVDRPHPDYPLMRLEIRSLAAWSENLEAALESLLVPLGRTHRAPTPSIE